MWKDSKTGSLRVESIKYEHVYAAQMIKTQTDIGFQPGNQKKK